MVDPPLVVPPVGVPLVVDAPLVVPPPVVCAITTLGINKAAAAIDVRIRIVLSCLIESEALLGRVCSDYLSTI